MTGLPKKFAKMGFKKGWRLYKQLKTKTKTKPRAKVKTTRGKKTMTKKRKGKKAVPKSTMEKVLSSVIKIALPVAYGFTRDKISNGIDSILDKTGIGERIPATEFTDEGLILATAWGVGKMGANKSPIGRQVLKVVDIVEKARIGETLSDIQQKNNNNTSSSSNW